MRQAPVADQQRIQATMTVIIAHVGMGGDHGQRVGDDVVQFAGDTHALLPDPLAGTLCFRGPLTLGLLGQSRLEPAPGRHRVPDEPRGRQRQETSTASTATRAFAVASAAGNGS